MAATQLDAKILELRLVTRDSTVGGSSVFKIAKSLREFNEALLQSPADEMKVKQAFNVYTRDVMLYKLEIGKVGKQLNLCDAESGNYKEQEAFIKKDMENEKTINIEISKFVSSLKGFTGEVQDIDISKLEFSENIKSRINGYLDS